MTALHERLGGEASLDLTDLFARLADEVVGVDLGDVRFDASGVIGAVGGVAGIDLDSLRVIVQGTLADTGGRIEGGLPTVTLPDSLTALTGRVGSLGALVPEIEVPDLIGIDGLDLRVDTVRSVIETGPLADLLGLVPGLQWSATLGRASGSLGGLVDLVRVLAGLTAMAAASRQVEEHAERLFHLLDPEASTSAGSALAELAGDVGLVATVRAADPTDAVAAEEIAARVTGFLSAAGALADQWATGMGYGEATLLGLDVAGNAAAMEFARLALSGVDLSSVASLTSDLRRAAAPLLDLPVPGPATFVGGFEAAAVTFTSEATALVATWDPAATLAPVSDLSAALLAPVLQVQQALSSVGSEVTGALGGLRGLVAEVDLTQVVAAVDELLQPVVEVLDTVEAQISTAQATLEELAGTLETALRTVGELIGDAATAVNDGFLRAERALDGLDLQTIAERLTEGLRAIASALSAAQLTPYFDTAIEVISTAADIIEQVPFGLLPTDIQQEIVEACRPIKQLDLQEVEDVLRAELAQIRGEFRAEALEEIESAYRAVVDFLASLDPQPHLVTFETTALGDLREVLDEIDPTALLAPVEAALGEVRGLLAGLDLEEEVVAPLRGVFQPILDALASLDPATLLAPVREEVDQAREAVTSVLHLDEAEESLRSLRARSADLIDRLDPQELVAVLDGRAAAALATLPDGPPGGAFGSMLVSLAEASGFRADEPAMRDVIEWVRGDAVGGEVVRTRLQAATSRLSEVKETVGLLDPAPLAASCGALHRALLTALSTHPADSLLRTTVEPMLAALRPDDVLAPLIENRRRYQVALEADAALLSTLSASGRSEVTEAAAHLHVAIMPLGAFPAKLGAILSAVGLEPAGRPLRVVVSELLATGVSGPLPAALAGLVEAAQGKVLEVVDLVVTSGLDAIGALTGILELVDLGPIVEELTALHTQVHDEVAGLAPDVLLGGVIGAADAVIARLAEFDPLAPVRAVIDAALEVADEVFESARPTVVFAPVVSLHQDLLRLAGGLDVVSLLRPVLDALDGIAAQLDDGFDRTGDALQELQGALPSEVSSSTITAAVDVGVSL